MSALLPIGPKEQLGGRLNLPTAGASGAVLSFFCHPLYGRVRIDLIDWLIPDDDVAAGAGEWAGMLGTRATVRARYRADLEMAVVRLDRAAGQTPGS